MHIRDAASARRKLLVPSGCPDIFPGSINQGQFLQTEVYYYCALASGSTRYFTDHDRLIEYQSSLILDPQQVSYMNLFVNGMLQPPILYEVRRGLLLLKTTDVPQPGVMIMLQFVKILLPNP
ncbi:DUF4183 domain-containing protein [Brevibacillus nitrificans]|uniref:DUF4183 domain-containing protein n=1 Tax=Brevibacillus nitrificans TaxID=651560 RepID=UPI00285EB126|nr:DUF4183 domain-containing protein [Brevibacillus nitrificans]MDR7315092.1 hypothetical protein [Brevibacillus nitrificans]